MKNEIIIKKKYILLFCLPFSFFCFSQENIHVSIPPPDIASLFKSIERPVSLYNGQVAVNIPLYTIKDGDIEVPISISYNTSGIKVADEASRIGLGWEINIGGFITQEIKGDDDNDGSSNTEYFYKNPEDLVQVHNFFPTDYSSYYGNIVEKTFHFNVETAHEDNNLSTYLISTLIGIPWAPLPTYKPFKETHIQWDVESNFFVNNVLNNKELMQPDNYYYSFDGYSGKFYINFKTNIIYQGKVDPKIKFEILFSYGDIFFKATTMDGTQYLFTVIGLSDNNYVYPTTRTFYLTKKILSSGEEINYSYESKGKAKSQFNRGELLEVGSNARGELLFGGQTNFDVKVLKEITTPNANILFNYSNRLDILKFSGDNQIGEQKLDNILIKNKNSSSEVNIWFNTDYFITQSPFGNYSDCDFETSRRRLKLNSVQINDQPPYQFFYNNTQLPVKTSYAIDYWGYYNGQLTNETFLPNINYLYIHNLDLLGDVSPYLLNKGSLRAPSVNFSKACMLEKIIYPTGGETQLFYEAHTFNNYKIATVEEIQNLGYLHPSTENVDDANCLQSYPNPIYPFEILINSNVRITGKFVYINNPSIEFLEIFENSYIRLNKLNSSNEIISTIFNWQFDGNLEHEYDYTALLNPGKYLLTSSIPDELGDQGDYYTDCINGTDCKHAKAMAKLYVSEAPAVNFEKSEGAGLRVSKIVQDPNSDTKKTAKRFIYETIEGTSGILMSPLKFHWKYRDHLSSISGEFFRQNLSSSGQYPISFSAMGSAVGYTKVTEYNIDLDYPDDLAKSNGHIDYTFTNFQDYINDADAPEIHFHANGFIEEMNFFTNNTLVKSVNCNYIIKQDNVSFGFVIPRYFDWGLIPLYDGYMNDYFTLKFYPLLSQHVLKTEETIIENNSVVQTIEYNYNSDGLIGAINTTKSDNSQVVKNFLYPNDYPLATNQFILDMKSKHIINKPIEVYTLKNNQNVIDGKLTTYKTGTDAGLPDEEYELKSIPGLSLSNGFSPSNTGGIYSKNSNYELRFKYDKYNQGNILQYHKNGDINTSFYWSYNNAYPVVKATNVSQSDLVLNVDIALQTAVINSTNWISDPITEKTKWTTFNSTLRQRLQDAMITTYTYKPLVGMTSQTDEKGITTYYEYDDFGRLKNIKDHNLNIIKHYEYHYQQPEE